MYFGFVEVDEPFVSDLSDKCRKMQCAQACDAVTGNCICRRGFKVVDDNRCEGRFNSLFIRFQKLYSII